MIEKAVYAVGALLALASIAFPPCTFIIAGQRNIGLTVHPVVSAITGITGPPASMATEIHVGLLVGQLLAIAIAASFTARAFRKPNTTR